MNSFNDVIKSDKPVLVDFFATWCGPCKMMAPILHDVKTAMGDKVTIIKIDVDKNTEVSAHYQVQGVPTLMLFRNGEVKWRQSGVMQAKQLQEIVTRFGTL
jgi:thioredoxin 1